MYANNSLLVKDTANKWASDSGLEHGGREGSNEDFSLSQIGVFSVDNEHN